MKHILASLLIVLAFPVWGIEIISGPYLQGVTDNEATIVWRTDSDATAWVETAPDDGTNFYAFERPRTYATTLGTATIGKLHKVTLKNLKPGTAYRYRIFSEEVLDKQSHYIKYGNVASTNVYTKKPLVFKTADSNKGEISFTVVNDMHADNEKLKDLVKDIAEDDFLLFNGDMVSAMNVENDIFTGFLNSSTELFASEKPFYMVRGNHETRGNHSQRFMDYFPTPTGKPFYTLTSGPVFFIMMDGGEDKSDNDIEYSRASFFDDYRRDEAAWLQSVLDSEEFKASPFKVVVMHVPPMNDADSWHGTRHAYELFVPMLNKAGIDLMLCGHYHEYIYVEPSAEGTNFPIIINSHVEALKVKANEKDMKVNVVDRGGKTTHSYTYTRKN